MKRYCYLSYYTAKPTWQVLATVGEVNDDVCSTTRPYLLLATCSIRVEKAEQSTHNKRVVRWLSSMVKAEDNFFFFEEVNCLEKSTKSSQLASFVECADKKNVNYLNFKIKRRKEKEPLHHFSHHNQHYLITTSNSLWEMLIISPFFPL